MSTSRLSTALWNGIAAIALISAAGFAVAQDVADMPRNQTLVMTPWGDQPAQFANIENWNPYLTSITKQRDVMQFTVNEQLFYTNLNTGELIPWQAESFSYSPDYITATIKLRDGVTWADGTPFTSADVKFTLEAVRDAPPELQASAAYQEWIVSVDAPDALTAIITFTKPADRKSVV